MQKFNAKRCAYKGMAFDSILERDRFIFLEDCQRRGIIACLKHHVPFALCVEGQLIGTYEADYQYMIVGREYRTEAGGVQNPFEVEDAKGFITDVFKLKRRIFEAQYRIRIRIVTKANLTQIPR